jgi:hypothetical protein
MIYSRIWKLDEFLKSNKVFETSVRIETNDYHQKMWKEQPNIGLKIKPTLVGPCYFKVG